MPVLCGSVNVAASGARWKPCHSVWPCDGGVVWKRAARPRRPHRAGGATMVGRARAYEVNTPENMADERVILTLAQTPWLIHQFSALTALADLARQHAHGRHLPSTHSRSTFVSTEVVFSPTQHNANKRSPRKSTLPQCLSIKHPSLKSCVCKRHRNHSARLFPVARPWKKDAEN